MISYSRKVSKNFALEINLFYFYRSIRDGLTVFDQKLDSDWYRGDHNPQIVYQLIIFNLMVIEIDFYNVNHVPDEEG